MELTPGTRLGPYEIVSHIGAGGMGEVFKARDTRLDRAVAVKIMPKHIAAREDLRARFEREARTVSGLNHPNICVLHDIGNQDGIDFMVLEYLEGETLAARIAKGPLPPELALEYAIQLASALEAAHRQNITHRDVKPANILITKAGVKVLDFGIAQLGKPESAGPISPDASTVTRALTQQGSILGTLQYMAPEQLQGKVVTVRADIFSFGCVLYEMLTGKRAFAGENPASVIAAILERPAPSLGEGAPPLLDWVLGRCLGKDPDDRWQSARDLGATLERIAGPGTARPERARDSARYSGWIAAALAIMATGALAFVYYRKSPPALPGLTYELTRAGNAGFAQFEISPDGRNIAFVSKIGDLDRLYVRALDSFEDREFPGSDGATYPFWSPDSTHIAFFSQGKLKQVGIGGGPATSIADAPDARGGAWARDGSIVFAPSVTGTLLRVPAAGGAAIPMALPRKGSGDRDSLRFPAFLPDSDHFLYTIEATTREGEGTYIGSLSGDPPVRILPDLTMSRFVASTASGSAGFILFRRQGTLMAQAFSPSSLKLAGEAFPLANDLQTTAGNRGYAAFTASSSGVLIYSSGHNRNAERELVWVARDGKRGESIVKQKGISEFRLSPDGTQLLYSLATQYAAGDLWLHSMATGTSQRFTFGPASAFAPVWSPDGTAAVYTVFPEDRLYSKKMASPKEEALPVTGTNTYATSWSTDGKLLVFSQTGPATKDDLWLLQLDRDAGPRVFRKTPYSERGGQISPDGRWIAYSSDPSDRFEVYIEPIVPGGAARQISVDGGVTPYWRADGRELYFVSDSKVMAVDVKPGPELTFGAPHELFRAPTLLTDGRGFKYQPSSDGRQFLALLSIGDTPPALPLIVVTDWQSRLKK